MTMHEQENEGTPGAAPTQPHASDQATQAREHANLAREQVNQAREEVNQARENANQVREDLLGTDAPMTTSRSPWEPDPDDQAYTLTDGNMCCRVWHAQGAWSAAVIYGNMSEAAYDFRTLEEACAWSEQQVRRKQ